MAIANLPRATVRGQRGWTLPCGIGLLVLLAVPVPVQARLAYDLGFVFLASPLILYGCSRFEPDRRLAPIAGLIGELSFALYLINYPMKGVFAAIANRWHAPEPLLAILYLAVCFALAWAAVRWFDTPARSFLGRMIGRSDRA
jgi:peptidoglycan/LPS O-acetylase OafA/YrhL